MATDNRTLPKKEHDSFRSLVTFYETKQYKKGIKTADSVLKKYPNHGETLAMKGLILNCLNSKDEAYELVKKGLKNDVRSHVCWHVFGLLHRSDRNYKESIKCYLNALRIDNDNQQILRDLSWLQVQIRDHYGYIETRRKLLVLKPSVRLNWVAYGVANYIAGEYTVANDVISKYIETATEKDQGYDFSEILLFQNRCLEASGLYDNALLHLDQNESKIIDKLAVQMKRAELLTRSGNFSDARKQWMVLVRSQTENYRFHCGLQIAILELDRALTTEMLELKALELPCTALDLNETQLAKLMDVYRSRLPKSRAAGKIMLSLARGDAFRTMLDEYMKKALTDGLPALYNDVCALIRKPDPVNPARKVYVTDAYDFRQHPTMQIALDLVGGYVRTLRQNETFLDVPGDFDFPEVPTALLWALYLQSHLMEACGRLAEALATIEDAVAHTPTALDVRCKKAKILKKCGDLVGACQEMEACRVLDLQDRYLNNKATKYFLRRDSVGPAMDTIALFTKHDGDPQQALFDLQCVWYELEVAESYARQGLHGPALKKFYAVESHFLDFVEDQSDFHGFAMRKSTVRAYLDMLTMEDRIFSHKSFQRAARGALEVFLEMQGRTGDAGADEEADEEDLSHLSSAERKKVRAKLRKAKSKATAAAAAKEAEELKQKHAVAAEDVRSRSRGTATVKDEDPVGEKILAKDAMEEMGRWAEEAVRSAAGGNAAAAADTLSLVCEASVRRGKPLLALRALVMGLRRSPDHPLLVVQLVRLGLVVLGPAGVVEGSRKPVTDEVLREELSVLLGGLDVPTFVREFAQRARAMSLPHRIAAARCLVLVDSTEGGRVDAASLLVGDDDDALWAGPGVLIGAVLEAHKLLSKGLRMEAAANQFQARALLEFPLANAFGAGTRDVVAVAGGDVVDTEPRTNS